MDSRRGRSRRKPCRCGSRGIRDRRLSMLLVIIMFASAIFDMPFSWSWIFHGPSSVFASGGKEGGSLWATASNAKVKEGKRQDVDIYVISEDNDVSPGNTSVMTLYLKNNTDQTITEGKLSFSSRYILPENGAFVDYQLEEDEDAWDSMEEEQDETSDPDAAEAVPDIGSEKEDYADYQEEGDEADPGILTGIDLEPGEWYEVYFEFYTEDDLGPQKASVNFRFVGEGEEGMIRSSQKFYYGIGLPNVNLELTGGEQVETGVLQEMNIWMTEPSWSSWVTEGKDEDEDEENLASDSDSDKASSSEAGKTASPSETDREDDSDDTDEQEKKDRETIKEYEEKAMDLPEAKVRYEVEIFGTEFRKFRPRKAEEVEDIGWINCVYQLAQDARPGIYYGKVKALGRWNNEAFTAEQGFLFEVTGEGTITLEDRMDGMRIQITGPASSFPEADELTLETGKITEEEQAILDGMILKEGQTVNALHFRLLADGEEKPLTGPVTVRLSGKKIEESAELIPEIWENAEETADAANPAAAEMEGSLGTAEAAENAEIEGTAENAGSADEGSTAATENMETAELGAESGMAEDVTPQVTVEDVSGSVEMTEEEATVILPERILRQGPGAAAAYMAGEEVTATRRIADNGTLIIRTAGNGQTDKESQEEPEEEIIADGQQAGIALLAVNLEYGQLEELECGITDQKRIQVETDVLPAAYVITDAELEEDPVVPNEADNTLTYEDEDVKVTVTLPDDYAALLGDGETEPQLNVELIASSSAARRAGEDGELSGGDNSYDALMRSAQEALSHMVASAVFSRIEITGPGMGTDSGVNPDGNTAGDGTAQAAAALEAGKIQVEFQFKKNFLDTRADGEVNVLQYVGSADGQVKILTPNVEKDDSGQVKNVVYTYEVNGLDELAEGTFGIVWTADFMGVNTGGPGTHIFTVGGIVLVLGAFWVWQRERIREGQEWDSLCMK